MKVLRKRSWEIHAENFDAMTRFYQRAFGAELRGHETLAGVNRLRAGETGLGRFDAAEKCFDGLARGERPDYSVYITDPAETASSCRKTRL